MYIEERPYCYNLIKLNDMHKFPDNGLKNIETYWSIN